MPTPDITFEDYGSGDPVVALTFPETAAGATSATQVLKMWYRKGGAGLLTEGALAIETLVSGSYVTQGCPALDEHWHEARFNGGENPDNDPDFIPETTDWVRVGSASWLDFEAMPGNTARYLEIRLNVPLVAGLITETATSRFVVRMNDVTQPAGLGVCDGGHGILRGVGDLRVTEFIVPPSVTAAGGPDVTVGAAGATSWMLRGVEQSRNATDTVTFNQDDDAAAALVAGEAYIGLVVQPSGDTARIGVKGLKAVAGSAVAPTVPANSALVAIVPVLYGGGGSVINTGDITVVATLGRGAVTSDSGSLIVTVWPFRALADGSRVRHELPVFVVHPPSVTRYAWLLGSGSFGLTAVDAPPVRGAVPWYYATTDGSGVTSLTERQVFSAVGAPAVVIPPLPTISPAWHNYTFTKDDFVGFTGELEHTLNVFALDPANVILGVAFLVPTAWAATGASYVYLKVGDEVNGTDTYFDGTPHIDVVDFGSSQPRFMMLSGTSAKNVTISIGSDVTLENLTDGIVRLYVLSGSIDP